MQAELAAIGIEPYIEGYRAVERIVGGLWPEVKAVILKRITGGHYFEYHGAVDILPYEGMIETAFEVARKHDEYALMHKVADIAIESKPEFAIAVSLDQARDIMNAARVKIYHHAITWLRKAQKAYAATGRSDEWAQILTELRHKHRQKSSLVPMLNDMKEEQ